MAKLVLRDGERELRRVLARDATRPARDNSYALVLTDLRVVVERASHAPTLPILGMLASAAFAIIGRALAGGTRIEHVIAREDFATAEVTENDTLLVRSKGSGYDMSWFELKLASPREWADLLHRWAAGEVLEVALPEATLVTERRR